MYSYTCCFLHTVTPQNRQETLNSPLCSTCESFHLSNLSHSDSTSETHHPPATPCHKPHPLQQHNSDTFSMSCSNRPVVLWQRDRAHKGGKLAGGTRGVSKSSFSLQPFSFLNLKEAHGWAGCAVALCQFTSWSRQLGDAAVRCWAANIEWTQHGVRGGLQLCL